MKTIIGLLIVVILLVVSLGIYLDQRDDQKRKQEIQEIRIMKEDILRGDSLDKVRFQQTIDSIHGIIKLQRVHSDQLGKFNSQIRKQNEAIRKIYNDMPDSGRPVY